ncbi:MAG: hypoxanthine phosphoribosyltransferase [Verrucomicrobiales bacterium]|nr:hypoxanthine phosphoribosyltransferase [Verrucomicrobiales bacterium]
MSGPRNHLERILFGETEIRKCIADLGAAITKDYKDKRPLSVVTILQGGALFMADLIREIHLPLKIESISVSSYEGTSSSGTVKFHQNGMPDLNGRHVLILDDILDSGRTLFAIQSRFEGECQPLSIQTCVFLSKQCERAVEIEADYVGFEVGDEFVVGYGLDYNGEYRNLPEIGVLKPEFYEK